MKFVIGLLVVAAPFLVVVLLLGRSKRNRGSEHGGGLDRYRDLRSGRP